MAITNIKVSNFKSFKDLDLNLGRFNVVIGANASGKSNFVEIFKFLRTLERENLDDAISLHAGRDSILNKKLGFSEPMRMRATSDRQMPWPGGWANIQLHETIYDFCLQIVSPQDGILIKDDHFTQKLRTRIGGEDIEMQLDVLLSDGTRKVEIAPRKVIDNLINKENESFVAFYKHLLGLLGGRPAGVLRPGALQTWKPQTLLIHHGFLGLMGVERLFERLGVYDIDPQAVKRPHDRAGRVSLQENGENLVLVLKQILADPEKSRKFHNLLRYMLPFAVEIGVEQYLGVSLLLQLREEYYEGNLLANLLSDGTVDVAALVTALFFEDKDVVIIEEPERNIHPHLISGLVELMKDAARNKQIIVTTHSPEVVKHAGVENLLLISRDKDGFSTMSRPAEKEEVKIFLKNDLGLDELFVQNILAI
jgi:predicted ATPase